MPIFTQIFPENKCFADFFPFLSGHAFFESSRSQKTKVWFGHFCSSELHPPPTLHLIELAFCGPILCRRPWCAVYTHPRSSSTHAYIIPHGSAHSPVVPFGTHTSTLMDPQAPLESAPRTGAGKCWLPCLLRFATCIRPTISFLIVQIWWPSCHRGLRKLRGH